MISSVTSIPSSKRRARPPTSPSSPSGSPTQPPWPGAVRSWLHGGQVCRDHRPCRSVVQALSLWIVLKLGDRERARPALAPLLAGTALVVLRPNVGLGVVLTLVGGFIFGLARSSLAPQRGAIFAAPLVIAAVVMGFVESWQLGALALIAAPFVVGTTALAAAAGSMMTFGDAERRRRAAILLGVGATVAVAVIAVNSAGHRRIDRAQRDLESEVVSGLTGFRSIDLVTGAFNDTRDQVGGAIGRRPSFVVGTDSVQLRFDLTPTVAPWLTRCLVARVEPIADRVIAAEDITMETTSESC